MHPGDIRGRRREREEAEPLEDRTAVVRGVDLQVPDAAVARDRGAAGDQGPVDAAPTVALEGRPAPQAGERAAGTHHEPGGGDEAIAVLGDQHADAVRTRGGRGVAQVVGDPASSPRPRPRCGAGRCATRSACVGGLADDDPVDLGREPGERALESDEQGLLLLRLESGGDQTLGQVGGLVVAVGLPLDGLAAGRERGDLAGDEGVESRRREGRCRRAPR